MVGAHTQSTITNRRTPVWASMERIRSMNSSSIFLRTFLPVAVAIVIIAVLIFHYERNARLSELRAEQRQQLQTAVALTQQAFADVSGDVRWAAQLPALRRMLATDDRRFVVDVDAAFLALLEESPDLDQIRYIDEHGDERVRVETAPGGARVVPEASLQNKMNRYYVRAALARPPGAVYASRFDLNVERGAIERPYKPVIRFATRVVDATGQARGVLVVNYMGDRLRARVRRLLSGVPGDAMLLNREGDWLLAPNPADEWGFMFGREPGFARAHPQAWARLQADRGQFRNRDGLYTFATIDPSAVLDARFQDGEGLGTWKLVSLVGNSELGALSAPLVWRTVLGAFAALIAAWLVSALFVRSRVERERLRSDSVLYLQRALEKQGVLDLFIRHTPAAVAMFDTDMRYMAASRRWYQEYGLQGDLAGRSYYEVFRDVPQRWRDAHQRALQGEVITSDEDAFQRADGSVYWLRWEVRPWFAADGAVGGIMMLTESINERKQAEAIRDGFIAKVSHELRTPITAVDGALKLLLGGVGGILNDRANTLVETAHRNSIRLLVLVNDLLDLQKIKLGEVDLTFTQVHIPRIAEDVAAACEPLASQKGVELKVETQGSDPLVITDGGRIQQVLTNFVSNAIRHTPAGRQVTIRCECDAEQIVCSVIDQGTGVPTEFMSRVFEDFEQADTGNTRTPGGSGLGLAIARALIEKLGGEIGFENLSEGGAVFYFRLFREDGRSPEEARGDPQHV